MAQAGPSRNSKAKKKGPHNGIRSSKVKKVTEIQSIEALKQAVAQFETHPDLKAFSDLPISDPTKRGLKKAFFVDMTDIQAKSLPVSLKGKDVLGAARTGSGKTLAFLVPVLEILYRQKWGPQDGLGALIISPTRELAVQIFEVLRSIGGYHTFSAGLVIGGKSLKDERERLARMNILVATPGRLLQHMDQTIGFECDNLQMLVLDEADRILDMGFQRTLTALLSHLPKSRQTLLFSATQTKSVSDLARLSLKSPVPIGLDTTEDHSATPQSLEQHYVLCTLDKKLDILFSFIRTHLQSKTLVFMSSCKQVRFVFEAFCKMHPGIPLLHLHGKQKQMTRLSTFQRFTSMKHAVLFATDIAARGLDFPAVDWVLQVDAPEDAETYIHRVGRTARYESSGKGLLFLIPSEEEGMKAALKKKGIEIQSIKIKASKTQSIEIQLQKLAFEDPEMKYLGQRAFVSYLRSVNVQKDKSIFKLEELPVQRYAESLGLPGAPKIKFLSKEIAKRKKNASHATAATEAPTGPKEADSEDELGESDAESAEEDGEGLSEHSSSDEEGAKASEQQSTRESDKAKVRTKYDRMFERKNQSILSSHFTKMVDHSGDVAGSDEDDDFITLKRADHDLNDADLPEHDFISKRKQKMAGSKKAAAKYGPKNNKLVFDDQGNPHQVYEMKSTEEVFGEDVGGEKVKEEGRKFVEGERGRLKKADVIDRMEAKEKKKEKKRKRKDRERDEVDGDGDGVGPVLAEVEDGYISPEYDLPSESEDEPMPPPSKRARPGKDKGSVSKSGLQADEELALQLLRGRR